MDYKLPDKITDILALFGLFWIISTCWINVELWLYGTTQTSVVDTVFAVAVSAATVVCLRAASIIAHEGD